MSYYDRGGYNGYNRHRGGFHNNGPRINENQVPQSKHTIFIRGLGGEVTTGEIEEYIGERVGKIKFDFVKTSQDRNKIFVAVRFEKREEAKEFMDTYSEREFMGYRCELSWFRDIRRYCAYQRSKQVRSNSQRRRRRSDSDESRQPSESPERRSKSRESRSSSKNSRRSRSRTRSTDKEGDESRSRSRGSNRSKSSHRSRSRSRSKDRSHDRSYDRNRDRSADRSKDRSKDKKGRSVSRDRNVDSRNGRRDSSRDKSESEDEKQRIRDRQARYKRRRPQVESDGYDSDDDKVVKRKSKEESLPQIPLPPASVQKAPAKPKTDAFIPPPTVDMEIDSPKNSPPPQHVNPYQMHPSYKPQEPSPQVQSTTYIVPIKEETPPKAVVREPAPQIGPNPSYPIPTHTASYNVPPAAPIQQYQQPYPQVQNYVQSQAPAPPTAPVVPMATAPPPLQQQTTPVAQQPAFVPRQVGKIEILMPSALPAPPPAPVPAPDLSLNGSFSSAALDPNLLPKNYELFKDLKKLQSDLLSTVEYVPSPKKEQEEDLSTLCLSSMDTEDEESAEELKNLEREEKLKKLNATQEVIFARKKKNIEAAYKKDCQGYTLVTNALISKNESLLFGLRMSLIENMEDMYKTMVERIDALLDQVLSS